MGVFDRVRRKGIRLIQRSKQRHSFDSRPRILFVSHEATRTGAPLIALNLLRSFAKDTDLQLETLLHNGGSLVDDFSEHSTVNCLNMPRKFSGDLERRIRRLVIRSRTEKPILAICNSMETRFIAKTLANLGIPILFFIHELPSSYTEADYQCVTEISQRIIFPVESVKRQTEKLFNIPPEKSLVLSQGLLNPEFGMSTIREKSRTQIREEVGIPEKTKIVLGCGTLDLRKGIDHFAGIARETLRREAQDSEHPIHFVWLGDGPRWTHSTHHYVMLDLQKSRIEHRVHFIGERLNVEPFFFGSDLFLLPSRVDPFPCVVHEAMAAQLPIITFDQSGGATEAVQNGAGIVVPFGDYEQAAHMIYLLSSQEHFAESIRQTALNRVSTDYCFADYANSILRISEDITGHKLADDDRPNYLPFAA